ncbi:DUF4328 domain-containing protein [Streptomyces sp. NPDC096176]|uniref:DUF4328 domain-containing protein n=1 Tax=Streptomyces sp. NPDC096176 TaxID=3366079 RepID=UPI0038186379
MVAAPAPPSALSRPLRSPVGLGRAAAILLLVVAVTDIAAITAALNLRRLMTIMESGDFLAYSTEDADLADLLMVVTSFAQFAAFAATVVVFIIWFHRVRSNAELFALDRFTKSRGWAIGGWFIPVAFLWIPRRVAAETWTASRTDPYAGDDHEHGTLVNVWWIAFVASWLVTRYADRLYDKAETTQEIVSAADALVVAGVVDIVAAVLAALFVRRLTHMQHARALGKVGATPAEAGSRR